MADSAVGAIRPYAVVLVAPRCPVGPSPCAHSSNASSSRCNASGIVTPSLALRSRASKRRCEGKRAPCSTMPSEQRLGARQVLLRRGAEHAPRIDGDQQFATVGRRTAALVVGQRLGTGQVADQRTGEQFGPSPPGPSPLCPPKVSMAPRNAALASVVGSPCSSTPSPAGSACRRVRATGSRHAPRRWWRSRRRTAGRPDAASQRRSGWCRRSACVRPPAPPRHDSAWSPGPPGPPR